VIEPVGSVKKSTVASFLRTIKMVLWGFLGIRKGSEWQEDAQKTNPFHIIVVGLIGVILLIVGLMVLVKWVVPT
jgi:amino acid transporter